MTDILQPGSIPDDIEPDWTENYVPPPFDAAQMKELVKLGTEEVAVVLSGLPVADRLNTIRQLQDLRRATADEHEFEVQVELNRARKRAKIEADRRDAAEREAYLSSDEGIEEAAEQFLADGGDIDDLEDPEVLIEGFLHLDTLVRTFGAPKTLKSFVTLDMAACVSLGIEWHGRRTRQARVLYVVAEGARGFRKRRDAWNEHHQTEMKVHFYPKPVQIADNEEMHRLVAFCRVKQIEYIIFDTQARCTVGIEENDNTEMGVVVHALGVLRAKTGACVHMVHHAVGSDPTKARGATAWDGAVDSEFYTRRSKSNPEQVELVSKFQKDIEEAEKLGFVSLKVGASLVLEATSGGAGGSGGTGEVAPALVSDANAFYLEEIRSFGNQAVSVTDVVKSLGGKKSREAVKKAFGALMTGGAIERTGTGTSTAVVITQAGLVFSDGWRRRVPPESSQTKIE